MNKDHLPSNPTPGNFTEQIFDSLCTMDLLMGKTDQQVLHKPISFHELSRYASEAGYQPSAQLAQALKSDLKTRRTLARLIQNTASGFVPKVAAASSGDCDEREGDGFKIRLIASKSAPDQLYIQIILTDSGKTPPRALFVRLGESQIEKCALAAPQNGIIQILSEVTSPLVSLLRNPETEVFFR